MKPIIGIILFTLILSNTKAQTLNDLIIGTWKVTADTLRLSPIGKQKTTKNIDKMPVLRPGKDSTHIHEFRPKNDIWKFTKDSLYYLPNYELDEPQIAEHCIYTIKDSVIYCYGNPAYRIKGITDNELMLTCYEGDKDAGLYIFTNPSIILYLKKETK